MPLGLAHCHLVFMPGYSSTNIEPLDRRCDRTGPLLHGTSPSLISEVAAAAANVENTGLFLWNWVVMRCACQEYCHLCPDSSPPVSEDTAENNLL